LSVVDTTLARAPLFRQIESQIVEIEPLGSLTNLSYKLTTSMRSYVLRLPGEDTFDYIDRRAEEHNGRITASVGVNAEVLRVDAEDGTMLSRFIEGVPMDWESFERDPMAPARAALVLRRVHRLGPVFRSRFDVFSMIRGYLEILYKLRMPPPEDYYEVEREAEAVRRVLQVSPVGLAPCHNDPWPGNFVIASSGGRLHLIDWEFSGMNDPMWDLGDLSVEARCSTLA
jgi:thiamine kinase-like enzyme